MLRLNRLFAVILLGLAALSGAAQAADAQVNPNHDPPINIHWAWSETWTMAPGASATLDFTAATLLFTDLFDFDDFDDTMELDASTSITGGAAEALTLSFTDGTDNLFAVLSGTDRWIDLDLGASNILRLTQTAGLDLALGNSTGNVTILSDVMALTLTQAGATALVIADDAAANILTADLSATDLITLGNTGDNLTVNAGTLDLNASATTLDGTTGSIDFTGASNLSVTGNNLTVSTLTSGTLAVTSAGILDLDAGNQTAAAGSAVTIDAGDGGGAGNAGGAITVQTGNGVTGVGGAGSAPGAITISIGNAGNSDTGTAGSGAILGLDGTTGGIGSGTAGIGGAGSQVRIRPGAGGNASAADGGAGGNAGDFTVTCAAAGSTAGNASAGGVGGGVQITASAGGTSTHVTGGAGGLGGEVNLTAGAGGAATNAASADGTGGVVAIISGASGGADGGATAGAVTIRTGAQTGGAAGTITIGDTNASNLALGNATGTFAVASSGLDVSTAGAIANAASLDLNGILDGDSATDGDTITFSGHGDAGIDYVTVTRANDAVEVDGGNVVVIDDNRTGTEADVLAEAALVLDSTGSHALAVINGAVDIADGFTVSAGTVTLPAGSVALAALAVPGAGQLALGNAGGTAFELATVSSDATIAAGGALTIAANAVALGGDTTGNYAAGDAEAGNALTGDTATAFFAAGTIEHEYGGVEANVSAYTGIVAITGGATYELNTSAELATAIGGDLAVADGGTGLSTGTSGGILGYTAVGTLASSALLTDSVLMVGGGVGATPTSLAAGLGTTTTVLHGNAGGESTWGAVVAGDITDIARSLPLPLGGWFDITSLTPISVDGAADAQPDYTATNGHISIVYDVTGGSVDSNYIANAFVVPADWISGGTIQVRLTKGGVTAVTENLSAYYSIDGAAEGAVSTVATAAQTAVQTVTLAPAGTLAVGASVGIRLAQTAAAGDDSVIIHGVEFQYTASQ